MLQKKGTIISWAELVKALEDDYGPTLFEHLDYTLFKLTQEDSVSSYYLQFTTLANQVEGMPIRSLVTCFIDGLKKNFKGI